MASLIAWLALRDYCVTLYQVLSNIHSVRAMEVEKDAKAWSFSPKVCSCVFCLCRDRIGVYRNILGHFYFSSSKDIFVLWKHAAGEMLVTRL